MFIILSRSAPGFSYQQTSSFYGRLRRGGRNLQRRRASLSDVCDWRRRMQSGWNPSSSRHDLQVGFYKASAETLPSQPTTVSVVSELRA